MNTERKGLFEIEDFETFIEIFAHILDPKSKQTVLTSIELIVKENNTAISRHYLPSNTFTITDNEEEMLISFDKAGLRMVADAELNHIDNSIKIIFTPLIILIDIEETQIVLLRKPQLNNEITEREYDKLSQIFVSVAM